MASERDLPGLAERLRQAREDSGLTQAQASKLVGIHRSAISEMEGGDRGVSAGEAKIFADIYYVSLDWLMGATPSDDDEIKLAARKLEGLRPADRDTVMRIIDSFRKGNR